MKGRKWLQRAAAVALTAAMCLTQGSFGNFWGNTEVKAAEGTLTDGTFDDSGNFKSNWNPKVASWDSGDNQSTIWQEKGYLNIWNALDEKNAMSISQKINLQAGVYQVSLDIKGDVDKTSGLFLKVQDGNNELINREVNATSGSDYKTIKSGYFELLETKDITLSLGGEVTAGYWANIDNITITKIDEDNVNYIIQGDFSSEDEFKDAWSCEVTSWEGGTKIYPDSEQLNMWNGSGDANTMYVSQFVTLQQGNYKLSLKVSGMASSSSMGIDVLKETEPGTWSGLVNTVEMTAELQEQNDIFETATITITEQTQVKIRIGGNVKNGFWINIDDVVLERVAAKEPTDLSKLTQLLATVPSGYETAGFRADTVTSLTEAVTNAKACTQGTDVAEVEACYNALEQALSNLVYEDSSIYVKKVEGMSEDFIKGIDISSYITETNAGVVYRDWDGQAVEGKDFIRLFAKEGVNYIRLRVWNDPKTADGKYYGGGNNDLAMTVKICQLIKEYNDAYGDTYGEVKVLVDIQYSDFWADPDKQEAPKAWKNMSLEQKEAAVTQFTTEVLETVDATGVTIGMVQIGNETNTGICGENIPEYKTENSTDDTKAALAEKGYIRIFKAGCDAVDAYNTSKNYTAENGRYIKKVVHFTDPHNAGTFFAKTLLDGGVNYDVYATSYYPFWHGTTKNLQSMLTDISKLTNASGKNIQVMVAETQYVNTNKDYDGADNQAYEGKNNIDLSGWPVSVQGQANELRDVIAAVAGVGEQGIGAFYWEPGWLGVGNAYDENGTLSESAVAANKNKWETYGCGWATDAAAEYDKSAAEWGGGGTNNENASLFDFTGHPLASLHVFKYVNYGAVAAQKSFYDYEYADNQGSIVVSTGLKAAEIKEKLQKGIDGAYIIYNDGSKDTTVTAITWSESSLAELEQKIATNSAIGNVFLVKGTVIVGESEYEVQASVNVEPAENLLKNGNFESTVGWTITPESMIFQNSENPRNGSDGNRHCIAFKTYENVEGLTADENNCYQARVSQQLIITEPGVYETKVFFEGGSGTGAKTGEKINVTVRYGDTLLTSNPIVLAGWMNWQCATISKITITPKMIAAGDNVVTVSANLLLAKDTWGSMDDFYLYKTADVEDEKDTDDNQTDDNGDNNPGETDPSGDGDNGNNNSGATDPSGDGDNGNNNSGATDPSGDGNNGNNNSGATDPAGDGNNGNNNSGATDPAGKEDNQDNQGQGENKPADETNPGGSTGEKEKEVEKEVSIGANTPVVSIGTDSESIKGLIFTDKLFTAEELAAISTGAQTKVVLNIDNITSTVSSADKAKIESAAKQAKVGMYLDLTLSAQIGTVQKQVKEIPGGVLSVTVKLPSELINTDTTVKRSYGIVRIHDGVAEELSDVTYENGMLTIKTNKFSVYAITYTDEPVSAGNSSQGGNQNQGNTTVADNSVPQTGTSQTTETGVVATGDLPPILPIGFIIVAAISILGAVVIRIRQKKSMNM